MDEEIGDKQKPKSKLSALKSRFQIHGHHKTSLKPNVSVLTQQPLPSSNNVTELDFSELRFPIKHGVLANLSIDGKWRKKSSLDIEGNIGEKKKESILQKFLFQRKLPSDTGSSSGPSTPLSDKADFMTCPKTHKQSNAMDGAIKENVLKQKKLRDSEFMSDPGISCGVSIRTPRQRVYLPLIEVENKSTERPLGMVFLTFREETKRSLLPNEITSLSTIWALFVRAFPDVFTMNWFEATMVTIYILNPVTKLYCPLRNLKEIRDRSALKIFEEEAVIKSKPIRDGPHLPSHQLWRRYDNSMQTIGHQPEKVNILLTHQRAFLRSQMNPHHIIRNGGIRSAPPMPKDYVVLPESGVYKSLHLRDSPWQNHDLGRQESIQSSASANSDISQATVVKSPLLCNSTIHATKKQRPSSEQPSNAALEMKNKMARLRQQAKALQNELNQLKQLQLLQISSMKETFLEATSKCEELILSANREPKSLEGREAIDIQKSGYADDVCMVEAKLRGLEVSIEDLKNEVLSRKGTIRIAEINKMAHLLNHVAKLLTELKDRLQTLQKSLKPLIVAEIGAIIKDDKFVKGEPSRLESLLNRCKHLGSLLNTLKKLALVQEQSKPRDESSGHSHQPIRDKQQAFSQLITENSLPQFYSQMKSNPNISEIQRSQKIPAHQTACIPSQSTNNLEKKSHIFDEFYKKLVISQPQLDNEMYLFLMQNLYTLCNGMPPNNQSYSSSSLTKADNKAIRNVPSVIEGTQSAPSTPMMTGTRNSGINMNHGFSPNDEQVTNSEISLAPYSSSDSSRYSSPISSETNLSILSDSNAYNHDSVIQMPVEQLIKKHRQNLYFHPSDLQQHLDAELLNELLSSACSKKISRTHKCRNIGTVSDPEDSFADDSLKGLSLTNKNAKTFKLDCQQSTEGLLSTTKYGSLYSSLYKMLDDSISKQQPQPEETMISCPHCSEGSGHFDCLTKHKADCPYQVHEAILRFSKNANSNSDLETGLCAKLTRAHLQEKLKMRQDEMRKQKQSKSTLDEKNC